MANHIHLLVVPHHKESVAKVIAGVHRSHSERVNRRLDRTGHLWQNRYFSTALDEHHLWAAVRYIERNPVRAGIVGRAEDYRWSSARAHCGISFDPHLSPASPFPGRVSNWREWLAEADREEAAVAALRENSRTGWPTGTTDFVAGLEVKLGRSLTRRPPGRPPSRGAMGADGNEN
jgi:putative transposase